MTLSVSSEGNWKVRLRRWNKIWDLDRKQRGHRCPQPLDLEGLPLWCEDGKYLGDWQAMRADTLAAQVYQDIRHTGQVDSAARRDDSEASHKHHCEMVGLEVGFTSPSVFSDVTK